MDDKRIEEIEARLAARTPGDWKGIVTDDGEVMVVAPDGRCVHYIGDPEVTNALDHINGFFIAHAPQDIRDLLDEVDNLKQDIRHLNEIVSTDLDDIEDLRGE